MREFAGEYFDSDFVWDDSLSQMLGRCFKHNSNFLEQICAVLRKLYLVLPMDF